MDSKWWWCLLWKNNSILNGWWGWGWGVGGGRGWGVGGGGGCGGVEATLKHMRKHIPIKLIGMCHCRCTIKHNKTVWTFYMTFCTYNRYHVLHSPKIIRFMECNCVSTTYYVMTISSDKFHLCPLLHESVLLLKKPICIVFRTASNLVNKRRSTVFVFSPG